MEVTVAGFKKKGILYSLAKRKPCRTIYKEFNKIK